MSGEIGQIVLGFPLTHSDDPTKEQLLQELSVLRQQVAELEKSQAHCQSTEAAMQAANQRIAQDLTARKAAEIERMQALEALQHSEERLRLALDAGQMGTWEWDMEANTKYWDPTQYALFGVEPNSFELNTETFFQQVHPEDLAWVKATLQTLRQEGGSFAIEFRIIRPDGSIHWLASKGRLIQNSEGKPLRMIGVNFDITHRKQAEAEREQLLERERHARAMAERACEAAENANRVKDEFLAVLSHELRSPLNPILGWAKLLQKRSLDGSKTIHALQIIERNARVQAQLIEDLLDISRILQGKLVLNYHSTDLVTPIQSAIETVRLSAEAKGIDLRLAITPPSTDLPGSERSSPFIVLGDANRLQQIFWNLLSNAIKFTPPGGQVDINLERVQECLQGSTASPPLSYAQVIVTDTGKGIPPDFLPHVFDCFRQADSSSTRTFGGLGLGLAIVRHLVELHGGTVQADSLGENQGATFKILLPLPEENRTVHPIPDSDLSALDAFLLENVHVLVVDDELDNLDLITIILQQAGATVLSASSAHEALTLFSQDHLDVLVTDIGMPEVDGYMLLKHIRALPPDQGGQIPAIALTAYAGEYNQQQALAAGFQLHLAKPVDPAQLVEAIASLKG